MEYEVQTTKRFERNLKRCKKRGLNMELLREAVQILRTEGTLPSQYRPHRLHGDMGSLWECHIQPDWLMAWEQNDKELTLLFTHTGTHADLFG